MAMFRAGNAFSKKQPAPTTAPAPAPAAPRRPFGGSAMPSMSRAKAPVAAPTTRGVPTDNYGNLYVGSRRRQSAPVAPAPAKTYNETQLAELRKADQALGNVAKSTYSPADLARIQQEQSKAMLQQPQQASGLKAVGQAPTMSPQVAQQMAAMGPRMPAMAYGGMTKKTGYAKGGAVMCGASMPPAQKRKK